MFIPTQKRNKSVTNGKCNDSYFNHKSLSIIFILQQFLYEFFQVFKFFDFQYKLECFIINMECN